MSGGRSEGGTMAAKKKTGGSLITRARSAISGRFVSKSTAKRNPRTTVTERSRRKKK
jgi:hypothetical protein